LHIAYTDGHRSYCPGLNLKTGFVLRYRFTRVRTTLWVAVIKSFAPKRIFPPVVFLGKEKKNRLKENELSLGKDPSPLQT
jgi:hypothetical protein